MHSALYPRVYNPAYTIGPCVLAIVFAAIFALIFPLIGLAVTLLLLLTLVGKPLQPNCYLLSQTFTNTIAHRFLVGYVYVRTHSQTGGIIYIWLLKRLGTLLSLQPICLGLILLSREFWIEGGILVGTGVLVILFVEAFVVAKNRKQSRKSLAPTTQNSLDTFAGQAKNADPHSEDEQGSLFSGSQTTRARGSMASVLEMMSLTLAVMPSSSQIRGPVPLSKSRRLVLFIYFCIPTTFLFQKQKRWTICPLQSAPRERIQKHHHICRRCLLLTTRKKWLVFCTRQN